MLYDFVVIGGGIVGLSSAMHLQERFPGCSLLLLEKEPALALHQTGRNSGVIHAGVYYTPGSLKARFCREGARATVQFCQQHSIPFERCGKLLVATSPSEVQRMQALRLRCIANGIDVQTVTAAELQRIEPRVAGLGALWVASSGIVDYRAIAAAMATILISRDAQIRLGHAAVAIGETAQQVAVSTAQETFTARTLVVCAGLMADRLAGLCGLADDFRIIPFRGEYYRLPDSSNDIIRHLIYPIPDPALPFLGVHLTRTIDGYVTVGPNAVLGFAREGYGKAALNLRDVRDMVSFGGFWRMARRHYRSALSEQFNSFNKSAYAALCRKYCPEITPEQLLPHPSGIRAQAVTRDGGLVQDFLIRRTARTLHICNAPSPAATSALPIGRYIAEQAAAM